MAGNLLGGSGLEGCSYLLKSTHLHMLRRVDLEQLLKFCLQHKWKTPIMLLRENSAEIFTGILVHEIMKKLAP